MKIRKLLAALFAGALMCVLGTVCAGAETYGDYTYSVLSDGTVKITDYTGTATTLEIPSAIDGKTVTCIGESAFRDSTTLTSVTIPDNVSNIERYAFYSCKSLKSVVFPDSLITVSASSFAYCTSLESISLPEGVKTIYAYAFEKCESLQSIELPDSLEGIYNNAFSGSAITTLYIPKNVSFISTYNIVSGCKSLTAITVDADNNYYVAENGVLFNRNKTHIYAYPQNKTEASYTVPDTVTVVCNDAFVNCDNLTDIILPAGLKTIADNAFYSCSSLSSIVIPYGVTQIGRSAFTWCKALKSVTIPDSVTFVDRYAFSNCQSLENVTLSENMTAVTFGLFSYCDSLQSVTIPSNISIIAEDAFLNCVGLQSVKMLNGVKTIYDCAFQGCTSLVELIIPDSVTTIKDGAFLGCKKLTALEIPVSVTSIGSYAFKDCKALASISVDTDNTMYCSENGVLFDKAKTILLTYPSSKTNVSYTIPDTVTSIGDYAFYDCDALTSLTIPENITSIGKYAFCNCQNLTSLVIPEGLSKIGSSAFWQCEKLASVTLPDTLTEIGSHAFGWCESLISIAIPESVTSIGSYAFYHCSSELKICCYENSAAHTYAVNEWFAYELLTKLAKVENLSATGYGVSAELTWDKNTAGGGYVIQQYKDNAWTTVMKITSNATTSYTVTGLSGSTTYKFRVAAYDANTGWKGAYTEVTATTTPTNITGVKATAYSVSTKLTWNKNTTATKYIIQQYKNNAWTTVKEITSNATTSYTVMGLSANKTYQFRIAGYNANTGRTGAYAEVTATTTPTNITGVKATAYSVSTKLTWNKNTTATKYIIQQYKNNAWTTVKEITSNATTSYTVMGLSANKTYKFRIAGYNANTGRTGAYAEVTATTTPTNITGVKATAYSVSTKLTWNKNTTATKYIIQQYKNNAWTTVKEITSNATTSYTVMGLSANKTYKFRIAGYNANTGRTGAYAEVTATTTPTNITGVKATAYSVSTKLTWNKNTTATKYIIQQYKNNAWTTVKEITSNATTSYTVMGLSANKTYKFRIAGYNANTGRTGAYAEVTATTTPTNITGVKATAYSVSTKLTWNKNTTATKYIIQQYKNNAWTTIKEITSNATTSYTVMGLSANKTYKFRIAGYNANTGRTGAYAEVTATTTPTNITGVKATAYSVSTKLTWNKNTTATKYIIQQYKNNAWTTVKEITSNATTSYTVMGLSANTTYKFRIAGYNATTGRTGAYTTVTAKTTN